MKYIAIFTLFVFCISQFFGYTFFLQASSVLPIDQRVSLDVSWWTNQQMELALSPDVFFWFETSVTNNTPDTLIDIIYHTDFPLGIVYRSETPRAFPARNGNFLQWSISLDEFYPPSIPNYSRVLSSPNELLPNDSYQMRRIVLKFPQNWSVYENVLKNHFTANNGAYISETKETLVYVNVKPHITDYYFEKADGSQTVDQVQGLHSEPVNLVIKVKDYNGCSNIEWWLVQADLSQLWLWAQESLSYISCEWDGKTAVFKKTGITTSVELGNYIFTKDHFTAVDIDGNQNNSSDTRFWNEDKTVSILLKVVESLTPVIDFVSLSEFLIWWPEKLSTLLTVSSSSSGSIKAMVWWDSSCQSGTQISDWENYVENTQKIFQVDTSHLSEGSNTLYICLEKEGYIGTLSRTITKDSSSPEISPPSYVANVWLNDTQATFSCSENGYFAWELLGWPTLWSGTGILHWTQTTANTVNTFPIGNSFLQSGQNIFHVFCKDDASNISYKTWSINKVIPVASMQGNVGVFWDFDVDYNGLDGRDVSVSWIKPIEDMSSFSSYYVYLLPSNIDFNISSHGNNYIAFLKDPDTLNFTGSSSILKDSTQADLVSWASYKACILIRGADLSYGEIGCSQPAILTSDIVQNAKILSAKFTSNTHLELTTDTTLDTNTEIHSGALISYTYNASTFSPTGIASINGSKITFTIPVLQNLWAVGSNIIMQTWALRSAGGWFNNYFSSGGLIIADGQIPTIMWFSNNTTSIYNNYFSGSIDVWFTFGESMKSSGNTKIIFDRVSWNASSQKSRSILDAEKLLSGSHIQDVDLVAIWLVSGVTYDMKITWQDLATNSVTSSAIVVKFDNIGPTAPTLIDAPNTSSQTPTLSWSASTDDNGNGSWVKEYVLRVFNSVNCSGWLLQTLTSATHSKATNSLTNGTYSWNVYAVDNMGNIGAISSCDTFLIDTTIPTIENQKITDLNNNNSTSFTKSWNTIEITADLTNTDSTKIKADLSSLTGNASHTWVLCSAPVSWVSCSYTSGKVTYSFIVWFSGVVSEIVRQIKLIVSNISEVNIIEKFASITVDNTPPITATISSPIGQTYGWNTLHIAWSGISDTNLHFIKIEYSSNGGTDYNFVSSWANISPYLWNISALPTGTDYKIKITWVDRSWNQSFTESQTFSFDKSNPTIVSGAILTPISWEYIKWNNSYTITWNAENITDNETLPANPITLEYSSNNGTNWTVISSTLPNTGSYNWNVPNFSSTQSKLRMKVRDNVWNESTYETTSSFVIDSQNPTFSITTGTPPNGAYINAGGFEALGTAGDNIKIDKIYYSFKRNSNTTYFNGSTYTWAITWNLLQDNVDSTSYNLNGLLSPTLVNAESYDFTLKVIDRAGNEFTTTPRQYIADLTNPNLVITNPENTYFSWSINISWTSSDSWAWISSVKISIKKWNEFWNGSTWVGTEQILATSTSNNYANWNYNFNAPGTDNDWQNYEIIVYAFDKSYKVNNTSSGTINIILDKTGPVIENDIFTFTPSGFYAGWSNFDITWNPEKISTTWALFSHIQLEYNHNGNFTTIVWNTLNEGSHTFSLPIIDDSITVIISAYDVLGNKSNSIASSSLFIDSTPPTILSLETMDMSADGQIDGLKVFMSEAIKDSTINVSDFSISGIGTPTSWETGNSANDNTFILRFADIWDTSTTPTLTYTRWNLTDMAWKFLESVSNVSSLDKASPRILTAEIFANNNGIFDTVEVNFSENISSSSDIWAFSLNNGLSISSVSVSGNIATLNLNLWSVGTDATWYTLWFTSNSNWKDLENNQAGSLGSPMSFIDKAKPVLVSSQLKATNYIADKIELTFSEALSWSLTWFIINSGTLWAWVLNNNTIMFDVSGISGTDPNINISYSWSLEDNFSNILDDFSNISVIEKISPKLQTATTLDQNGNGKIDGVLLELSEELNGNLADLVVSVNGYVTSWYAMDWSQSVIVSVGEKQLIDTSSTPSVTLSSNNALTDTAGNKVLSNQTLTSQDGVWPVIIWARFDEWTLDLHLTFSESVSGSLNNSSFVLQNIGASIVSTNFIDWENTATLTLSNDTITYGISEISFVWNIAWDSFWNKQSDTHFTKISASVLINEYLSEGSVSYIELKNISSSPVNIWWWIIENALSWTGLVIDTYSLSAWEYYLIATNNTSFSWITANQIASLDINSNLVLKNGSIIVDNALYQIGSENISFERFENCSDGWNSNCWYQAVASNGFNNINYKWTPATANIFDFTPPNLTTNLTWNLLLPIWYYNLIYTYSDDILIDTGSIEFSLQKWNGSNFINTSWYTTGTIDNNNANFSLSWLEYGRYKTIFSITDIAGNISTDTKEFYIDNFSFTISTGSIHLWILEPNNLKLANTLVNVEVKTIWAWFEISHHYDENNLWDWDGDKWFGACLWNNCTTLENYKNNVFVNQAGELQSSWELKTYNYTVKYGSLVDGVKPAWLYQVENKYRIGINY